MVFHTSGIDRSLTGRSLCLSKFLAFLRSSTVKDYTDSDYTAVRHLRFLRVIYLHNVYTHTLGSRKITSQFC